MTALRQEAVLRVAQRLTNPDLVERLRRDLPLAEAQKETWYGGGAEGYTDWPRAT